jgi:hypothetical protein
LENLANSCAALNPATPPPKMAMLIFSFSLFGPGSLSVAIRLGDASAEEIASINLVLVVLLMVIP